MNPSNTNGDITGGFSNKSLLLISSIGFTLLFLVLGTLYIRSSSRNKNNAENKEDEARNDRLRYEQELEGADVATLNRTQRRARAKILMKKNRRLADHLQPRPTMNPPPQQAQGDQDEVLAVLGDGAIQRQQGGGADAENIDLQHVDNQNRNLGQIKSRKERQRLAKAIEREERRQYVDERKQQIQNHTKQQTNESVLREKKKKEHLEQEKKRIQKRKYQEWNLMFPSLATSNSDIDESDGSDDECDDITVKEFVDDLNLKKKICLIDTAEKYSVSLQDLKKRLKQLEDEGRIIHGILDEQTNEYMVLTLDDMTSLAQFIKSRGSVSLEDIRMEMSRRLLRQDSGSGIIPVSF